MAARIRQTPKNFRGNSPNFPNPLLSENGGKGNMANSRRVGGYRGSGEGGLFRESAMLPQQTFPSDLTQ